MLAFRYKRVINATDADYRKYTPGEMLRYGTGLYRQIASARLCLRAHITEAERI